jgi:hypothetical protein
LLKFLLYLLIIFFVLRALGRFFVVSTFSNLNKKMEEQMRKQQQAQQRMPEGHVTIDADPAKRGRSQGNDGDYIDYEEVK